MPAPFPHRTVPPRRYDRLIHIRNKDTGVIPIYNSKSSHPSLLQARGMLSEVLRGHHPVDQPAAFQPTPAHQHARWQADSTQFAELNYSKGQATSSYSTITPT